RCERCSKRPTSTPAKPSMAIRRSTSSCGSRGKVKSAQARRKGIGFLRCWRSGLSNAGVWVALIVPEVSHFVHERFPCAFACIGIGVDWLAPAGSEYHRRNRLQLFSRLAVPNDRPTRWMARTMSHSLITSLRTLKGNPRGCVYTEPLWGIPFNLISPYASVYMLALGLTDRNIGLVLSVSWGFQVFWALMSGAITDKLGRRRTTLLFDI